MSEFKKWWDAKGSKMKILQTGCHDEECCHEIAGFAFIAGMDFAERARREAQEKIKMEFEDGG